MQKIIKIIDERETQKQKNTKRQKKGGGNVRLVILFDMFLNPRFKMATSVANVARTRASTSKFIY